MRDQLLMIVIPFRREGFAPAYIARKDEPQPLDQTDLKQWSRCVVEVSWRPSREVELSSLWVQAGQPNMWGRPALPVSRRASVLFPCPLVSSRTFSSILVEFRLDLVWFLGSYSSPVYSILIPKNSQITKAVEIIMLVHKTLA
jgi:hypothetical protein